MPALWAVAPGRGASAGGVIGYPVDRVYQEVAFLGRYVHWTLAELLSLDHAERQRWVQEVTSLVEPA
jgi:hypothetical protein